MKSTIPPKHGRPTLDSRPLKGKYRELMRTEFDKKIYGQRWQVETVMSRIKRNQGDYLRSKTYWSQNREMMLRVLSHNIGIILFAKELFDRACLTYITICNYTQQSFFPFLIYSKIFKAIATDKLTRLDPFATACCNFHSTGIACLGCF